MSPTTVSTAGMTGASAPPTGRLTAVQLLRGRAIARWQLSLGLGRALAPLTITAALDVTATALWLPLAAATVLGASLINFCAPTDTGRPDHPAPRTARRRLRERAALERAEIAHALHRDGYRRPDQAANQYEWQRRGPLA